MIPNDYGFDLAGPVHKYAKLPVQFSRELTERPGHFRIYDFVPLHPLLTEPLKGFQLLGF
jgi:hypothetical protein